MLYIISSCGLIGDYQIDSVVDLWKSNSKSYVPVQYKDLKINPSMDICLHLIEEKEKENIDIKVTLLNLFAIVYSNVTSVCINYVFFECWSH